MSKIKQHEKCKDKKTAEEESYRIDQELHELILKNESFKKGITKLVEEIDKNINKEQNKKK